MKAIPFDTRHRILACYDTGKHTRQTVADLFGVSLGLVKKLLQQRKTLGHAKMLYDRVGRKPTMTQARVEAVLHALRQTPGLTLGQMRELLGNVCTGVCIHLALKKNGVTFKKKRYELPSKTVRTCWKNACNGACAPPRFKRKGLCL